MVGGVSMLLAELKSGDAFGEEALVSDVKRNATVTMKSDGALLKLAKKDFVELLREPLLHRVSAEKRATRLPRGRNGSTCAIRPSSSTTASGGDQHPLVGDPQRLRRPGQGKGVRALLPERTSQAPRRRFSLAQRGYRAFVLGGGLGARPSAGETAPRRPLGAVLARKPGPAASHRREDVTNARPRELERVGKVIDSQAISGRRTLGWIANERGTADASGARPATSTAG